MMKPINYSWLKTNVPDKVSYPARWLLSNGFVKGEVLNLALDKSGDVDYLTRNGVKCVGYDKYHQPDYPKQKFDTILCVYVLNRVKPWEQSRVLMEVSELLKPGGKAYFVIHRTARHEEFPDQKEHPKNTSGGRGVLPYRSILKNNFCEIYEYIRVTDQKHASDCIFCRPAANLEFLTESAGAFAVYDGYPVSEGHALVISKKHVADFFLLSRHEQDALWIVVNRVKQLLEERYHPDGFNVGFNVGESAGQTVFHAHVHVIPRYTGDMEHPRGGIRHVIPSRAKY